MVFFSDLHWLSNIHEISTNIKIDMIKFASNFASRISIGDQLPGSNFSVSSKIHWWTIISIHVFPFNWRKILGYHSVSSNFCDRESMAIRGCPTSGGMSQFFPAYMWFIPSRKPLFYMGYPPVIKHIHTLQVNDLVEFGLLTLMIRTYYYLIGNYFHVDLVGGIVFSTSFDHFFDWFLSVFWWLWVVSWSHFCWFMIYHDNIWQLYKQANSPRILQAMK